MLKNSKYDKSIGAVMVLFDPDWSITSKAISILASQVDLLCIIDNTPYTDNSSLLREYTNIHYIPLQENKGIAAAQNIGIKYLLKKNIEFVLFSDQDSYASIGLIDNLVCLYNYLDKKGINVAAVGPLPYNYVNNHAYITKKNIIRNIKEDIVDCPFDILEMNSIISSYSLIRLQVFEEVGLFNEKLFIDGVDDEWGWRARSLIGGRSFVSLDNKISHIQGSDASKPYKKSTPFRTYYQFRNFFWLIRLNYTPKYWIRTNWVKIILKTFFYPICVTPRLKYLKNIIRGYKDGFKKRL